MISNVQSNMLKRTILQRTKTTTKRFYQ